MACLHPCNLCLNPCLCACSLKMHVRMSFLFFDTSGRRIPLVSALPLLDNAAAADTATSRGAPTGPLTPRMPGLPQRHHGQEFRRRCCAACALSAKANTSWSDQCITKSAKPAPVWVDAQDLVVREIRVGAEADRVVARLDIMGVDSRGFLRCFHFGIRFPCQNPHEIRAMLQDTIGDLTVTWPYRRVAPAARLSVGLHSHSVRF